MILFGLLSIGVNKKVSFCRKVVILLAFYVIVSGVALMKEGCDIIDLLCYCVRSGSYLGRL